MSRPSSRVFGDDIGRSPQPINGLQVYVVTNPFADSGGIDLMDSSVTYSLPANLENLTLKGEDDPIGTENDLSNRITGNAGSNEISGGDGNDTLLGGDGSESLHGGLGDDSLDGRR